MDPGGHRGRGGGAGIGVADGAILHYDGSTRSKMDAGTIRTLRGVWGSSSSDVFAVGEDGTILHYSKPDKKVTTRPTVLTKTTAPPSAPAAFSISNLTILPVEVQPEEVVTITVSVANTGGTEGSYTAVLKVNGTKETEKSVTIAAGNNKIVTFSITREETSSYSVAVDDLSASFNVVAPSLPVPLKEEEKAPLVEEEDKELLPEEQASLSIWIWLGIALGIILIGFVFYILSRKRVATH